MNVFDIQDLLQYGCWFSLSHNGQTFTYICGGAYTRRYIEIIKANGRATGLGEWYGNRFSRYRGFKDKAKSPYITMLVKFMYSIYSHQECGIKFERVIKGSERWNDIEAARYGDKDDKNYFYRIGMNT